MKSFIKKYISYIIGTFVGALAGYLYWRFIGCNSGTCPITSSPLNSTLYGALMGALAGGLFKSEKSKSTK
ncbi:MAG: DUF6132 family protein [Bacteroidales bacterium]|nr:DUF6132 family protein [Bacteroidales bacterium]